MVPSCFTSADSRLPRWLPPHGTHYHHQEVLPEAGRGAHHLQSPSIPVCLPPKALHGGHHHLSSTTSKGGIRTRGCCSWTLGQHFLNKLDHLDFNTPSVTGCWILSPDPVLCWWAQTVVGPIRDKDELSYREEVSHMVDWCGTNNLVLNVDKTKEIIVDFRKHQPTHVLSTTRQWRLLPAPSSWGFLLTARCPVNTTSEFW